MCEPAGVVPSPTAAPDPVTVTGPDDGGAGCPELVELLDTLAAIDRATARAVELAGRLEATGAAAEHTGVPLELSLAIDGRQTRADRRGLLAAADVLVTMPATMQLLRSGGLSWSQVRAIVEVGKQLPRELRVELDADIAAHVEAYARTEPDDLVDRVLILTARDPVDRDADDRPLTRGDFVALQPRLDGGGTGYFEYADPVRFADIAERLDSDADRLLATAGETVEATRPGDHDADRAAARTLGQARAAALHQLAVGRAPGVGGDTVDAAGDAADAVPVQLQAVVPLASLLDRSTTPGWLLTTLAGGRLKLTATAARRLVDERGADLRTVIVDDTGQALGVGRRTRKPPGWLREVIHTLDPTCTAPCCRTAARVSQIDHADPWTAHEGRSRDTAGGGRADADVLHATCQTHNLDKQRRLWDVDIGPDGTRTWRHRTTGWTATSMPATRAFVPTPPEPAMPPLPPPPGDPPEP